MRDLGQLIKANPGKCKVVVQLVSEAEKLAVDLPSKGLAVAISEELIVRLDGIAELSYTLN